MRKRIDVLVSRYVDTFNQHDAEGKDVRIWRHEPDGSWAIAFDIWNSDRAPPG